jgi:hypothetical protein
MNKQINSKINLYQLTVIFSLMFTLVGFSYNVWRMEASESNNNIRTASFEMLKNLSSLEQLIYAAHYDKDIKEGNARNGWVTIGLISDLSILTSDEVKIKATSLNKVWSVHWESMPTNEQAVNEIVKAIDSVRDEIKHLLNSLE